MNGAGESQSRFRRLMNYLDHDADNLSLIADAADAAFDASELSDATDLLDRYRKLAPLPASLVNLEGLTALRSGRLHDAATIFDVLIADGVTDLSVRFNRAWVHALHGEHGAVLALLGDDVVAGVPRAAALKVRALHHLGRIEEALAAGQGLAERFPHDDALLGALSVVAMDADDLDLARHYALQAQGGADALTTRGLIALDGNNAFEAVALFDRALAEHRDAPRAWLGKGLGLVAAGKFAEGAAALQRGAEIFGNHLGSWIALGWTQTMARDLKAARTTFERALVIDENFAETHGGLAVLDIVDGDLEGGKRKADIALRLDRQSFGGMLAKMLLLEARGDVGGARRIWDRAIDMPVGAGRTTLAQAVMAMGLNRGRSASTTRGDEA